jgi:hypothetical protein
MGVVLAGVPGKLLSHELWLGGGLRKRQGSPRRRLKGDWRIFS